MDVTGEAVEATTGPKQRLEFEIWLNLAVDHFFFFFFFIVILTFQGLGEGQHCQGMSPHHL